MYRIVARALKYGIIYSDYTLLIQLQIYLTKGPIFEITFLYKIFQKY